MPGAKRTRSLTCENRRARKIKSPRVRQDIPAFPHANGFTVSFVLAPETGLSCLRPRAMRKHCRELISASGYQAHTTSPSATATFVSRAIASTASLAQRVVTIARYAPLYRAGTTRLNASDLPDSESEIYLPPGLDMESKSPGVI